MPRPRAKAPPVDDPITDPDKTLADMLALAAELTPAPRYPAAANGARLAGLLLAMHAHLSAPTPGVLPTAWARAPELADGTLATCKHCRAVIRAQGPRPDWAAVYPQDPPAPVLYCNAHPDVSNRRRLPMHEPVAR